MSSFKIVSCSILLQEGNIITISEGKDGRSITQILLPCACIEKAYSPSLSGPSLCRLALLRTFSFSCELVLLSGGSGGRRLGADICASFQSTLKAYNVWFLGGSVVLQMLGFAGMADGFLLSMCVPARLESLEGRDHTPPSPLCPQKFAVCGMFQ